MTEIFRHTDGDGDRLQIRVHGDHLIFRGRDSDGYAEVSTYRETVIRLHEVLGEWLYPNVQPTPAPMTPGDVRAMVSAQVAEIMALHQAPQAKYVDVSPEACAHLRECECAADPEPKDVGFPEDPRPPLPIRNPLESFARFTEGFKDALAAIAASMPEPAREHPQPTWDDELFAADPVYCTSCGHVWQVHWNEKTGCTAQMGKSTCPCTRVHS